MQRADIQYYIQIVAPYAHRYGMDEKRLQEIIEIIANGIIEGEIDTWNPKETWNYAKEHGISEEELNTLINAIYDTQDGEVIYDLLYHYLYLQTLSDIIFEVSNRIGVDEVILSDIAETALEKDYTLSELKRNYPELVEILGRSDNQPFLRL